MQTPLLKSFKREEQQKEIQKSLRAEYNIEDKNILIVEKRNTAAQILRAVFNTIFTIARIVIGIILISLATIGLASIIYPNIRKELISNGYEILQEIKGYFSVQEIM